MDTATRRSGMADPDMMKSAADIITDYVKPLVSAPTELTKAYLALAAGIGLAGGAGIGTAASYIKSKNPKLTALKRKKKYYDSKLEEMANENWLNEVMTAKKKLETSRLTDEERSELEDKYIKLLDRK